ncbi:hypothetical protein CISG_09507 [Coccidioides immitis RMSCC 3703]|uniref:Uncharacterized protein n=1 Tax=Coccidioides immitis RMSCC 3703 TaxID=454286 RepID=A0A0J8QJ82_COCIT|nr:hypothetical protein CISG_09507 [Coccidioides immitis RMSCC 3703]
MPAPAPLPKRPILSLPFLLPFCSESTVLAQRNQSTYRRLKQRLRAKPEASFGQSPTQKYDHIVYNPPSSAPSVYRTPTKFLPPNDIRRKLRSDSDFDITSTPHSLPLVSKRSSPKKNILTAKEVDEIRQLRLKDPVTWSRGNLGPPLWLQHPFCCNVSKFGQRGDGIALVGATSWKDVPATRPFIVEYPKTDSPSKPGLRTSDMETDILCLDKI